MLSKRSGLIAVAACIAVAAAVATWVVAGPIIPSGTGSYGNLPVGSVQDIWNGPAGKRVGIKVASTVGAVMVQVPGDQVLSLGPVGQGRSSIFEGDWAQVQVRGLGMMGTTVSGLYETRGEAIQLPGTDGTIGQGWLALPAVGSQAISYSVYKNFAPTAYRPLTVHARLAGVSAWYYAPGATPTQGTKLLDVDAGDWAYVSASAEQGARYEILGNDGAAYGVYDLRAGGAAVSGTASGAAPDADSLRVDGSTQLAITVTNSGTCPIEVLCSPLDAQSIPATESRTFTAAFTEFVWTYQGEGGAVTVTVAAH